MDLSRQFPKISRYKISNIKIVPDFSNESVYLDITYKIPKIEKGIASYLFRQYDNCEFRTLTTKFMFLGGGWADSTCKNYRVRIMALYNPSSSTGEIASILNGMTEED